MCPHCYLVEVERGQKVFVYRCSQCGGCFACEHVGDLKALRWLCFDGVWRPARPDPGIPVPPLRWPSG